MRVDCLLIKCEYKNTDEYVIQNNYRYVYRISKLNIGYTNTFLMKLLNNKYTLLHGIKMLEVKIIIKIIYDK